MNENGSKNANTNHMISRLIRELDKTTDARRKQEIEKEIDNLRRRLVK